MARTRSASLLLGVLLLLVSLEEATAQANKGIPSLPNNDQVLKGNLELREDAMKAAATTSKWPRGRKIGAEYVVKDEQMKVKNAMKTGKSRNSSKKLAGSSNPYTREQNIDGATVRRALATPEGSSLGQANISYTHQDNTHTSTASSLHDSLGSPQQPNASSASNGSHDQFQTMETQKLLKATAEILNMLNKDYHAKAHRQPPINNDLPLEDDDAEP